MIRFRSLIVVLCFLGSRIIIAQSIEVTSSESCLGEESTLSIDSPELNSTYLWDLDNDGFYNDATGTDIKFTFPSSGENLFKVLKQSGGGWTSDELIAIVLPLPHLEFITQKSCGNFLLEEISNDWDGLSWKVNEEGITPSNQNILDYAGGEGVYNIEIEAEKLGCISIFLETIQLVETAIPIFNHPTETCLNDTIEFTVANTEGYNQLLWKFSDQTQLVNEGAMIFDQLGEVQYELTYRGENSDCKNSLTGSFMVNDLPEFSIVADIESPVEGDQVILSPSITFENPTWSTSETEEAIDVTTSGEYILTQSNAVGCSISDSIIVEFLSKPETGGFGIVNEVVTPYEDEVNDYFLIENASEPIKLKIFSREGRELYSSEDYQNDWNGQFNANALPTDTYYYQINHGEDEFIGTLHLINK